MLGDLADFIAIAEPRLPNRTALSSYLAEIDNARRYSNFGPLVQRFEQRLAERFGVQASHVVTTANATLGLMLALMAQEPSPGGLCLMPSYTFAASAHAALAVGLTPYFVDVANLSWALEPDAAHRALKSAPGPVAAVLAVAPFGAPIDYAGWETFKQETGLPVVIDGAAAFDTAAPGSVPVVFSFHASKALGIGEGGAVIARDTALVTKIRERSSFGFRNGREAYMPALNAKLSEYGAAVGLAALDAWPYVRIGLLSLARSYVAALSAVYGLAPMPGFGGFASATCSIRLGPDQPEAELVRIRLAKSSVEAKRWWGDGCHTQPAFLTCPRAELPVTETLARQVIGLPFHLGLGPSQLNNVIGSLADAVVGRPEAVDLYAIG
jgi:dTDP-4-amino-4,6-dideoxygalactose transaminase